MARFRCTVCNYFYDEGWERKRFEDVWALAQALHLTSVAAKRYHISRLGE